MTQKFMTNLNCGSCVAAVAPFLDNDPSIERWSVNTDDPMKVLTVEGKSVSTATVERHVARGGFRVLGKADEAPPQAAPKESIVRTYRPLLLVFSYLVGLVAIIEAGTGSFDWTRAMGHFMGGFFVAFSFFKLLDLPGFVNSFQTYDVLARRSTAYGYLYPFIEVALGIAYIMGFQPILTNLATLAVMLLGLGGVTRALLQKQRIKCACLGAVFNLPMSTVTFFEDALMAGMAVAMLAEAMLGSWHGH